jgi:hypothetical protein
MKIGAVAVITALLCANVGAQTAVKDVGGNHPFSKVDMVYESQGCSFPYSPVDFCNEKHLAAYKEAINTRKADFAGHYVLLSVSEWPRYYQRSVVAIDVNTGVVYPLPIDAYSGVTDSKGNIHKDGILEYKATESRLCIKGGILVYRAIDEGTFCFKFEGNQFTGHHTEYMN